MRLFSLLVLVSLLGACDSAHHPELRSECVQYLQDLKVAIDLIHPEIEVDPLCLDCLHGYVQKEIDQDDPRYLKNQIKECTLEGAYNFEADFYMAQIEVGVDGLYREISRQWEKAEGKRSFESLRETSNSLVSAVNNMIGELN